MSAEQQVHAGQLRGRNNRTRGALSQCLDFAAANCRPALLFRQNGEGLWHGRRPAAGHHNPPVRTKAFVPAELEHL